MLEVFVYLYEICRTQSSLSETESKVNLSSDGHGIKRYQLANVSSTAKVRDKIFSVVHKHSKILLNRFHVEHVQKYLVKSYRITQKRIEFAAL